LLVVPWINERRGKAPPAAFLACDTAGRHLCLRDIDGLHHSVGFAFGIADIPSYWHLVCCPRRWRTRFRVGNLDSFLIKRRLAIFGATSVGGNFVFIKCVVVGRDAGSSTADG
jgi:hypothetical protein